MEIEELLEQIEIAEAEAELEEQKEMKLKLEMDECEGFDHTDDLARSRNAIDRIESNLEWLRDRLKIEQEKAADFKHLKDSAASDMFDAIAEAVVEGKSNVV